jgi:radical SAM superfamily enzyme YgiQ (UPF0313 family)
MATRYRQRLENWLSQERGAIAKEWGGRISIALVYPNRYFVAMSNLGFQTVYRLFNQLDQVVCERFFLPESEDLPQAAARAGPLSLESRRPLKDFHIVAFSVAFENDFPNLVHLLHLGNLNVETSRRRPGDPLVVAGGVAAFLNPEPIAPFVDLVLLGEAEPVVETFVSAWEEADSAGLSGDERLLHLAGRVPGAYAPSLYRPEYRGDGTLAALVPTVSSLPPAIRAQAASFQGAEPAARSAILTPHTEFAETTLVEIGRGCGRACRFCAAGFVYRPVRFRSQDAVARAALGSHLPGGKVGLVSAAVSDHPEIEAICLDLRRAGASLTVSSLRADSLTPTLLRALRESGLRTVAIAPEAGSDRLRRVINKDLTEEEILEAVTAVADAGIPNVRLYFMIGLPTETEEDVAGIIRLVKGIKHRLLTVGRGRGRLGTITVSVSSFVPKPATPFQWCAFGDLNMLKQRIKRLKRGLGSVPNVRVHADVPKWAYLQALLARGDRRLAPLLVAVVEGGGSWARAMKRVNVNPEFYVYRERAQEEVFPWDFIDHGVRRDFLWSEYEEALAGRLTPPCEPERCRRCGVCGPTPLPDRLTSLK